MRNPRNRSVIDEFRANAGIVGGTFVGVPIALLHHTGRVTGTQYVTPVVYLSRGDGGVYIFASNGGEPHHPQWYGNLIHAGTATVEIGTEAMTVSATEVHGRARDAAYDQQALLHPRFLAYENTAAAAGRLIPVLELRPTSVDTACQRRLTPND